MVTMKDIADACGIGPSSVCKILSGKKFHVFSKETIKQVRDTAERMGYKRTAKYMLVNALRTLLAMAVAGQKPSKQFEAHVQKLISDSE